jgi:hypothetical protein
VATRQERPIGGDRDWRSEPYGATQVGAMALRDVEEECRLLVIPIGAFEGVERLGILIQIVLFGD